MRPCLPLFALLLSAAAHAQVTVPQRENVSYEHARVLRVTPVYQTLNATAMETRCEPLTPAEESRIRRVVGAVRGAFERGGPRPHCRSVPVSREFRRPIAFDVDYTYRGARYRSRLAQDPGHLLRIRVSVMPAP